MTCLHCTLLACAFLTAFHCGAQTSETDPPQHIAVGRLREVMTAFMASPDTTHGVYFTAQTSTGQVLVLRDRIIMLLPSEQTERPLGAPSPARAARKYARTHEPLGTLNKSISVTFAGALPGARPVAGGPAIAAISTFAGNDATKWRTALPLYSDITFPELYPGIDLLLKTQDGSLKYEYIVHPGGNPNDIRMEVTGADSIRLTGAGDIHIHVGGIVVRDAAPRSFQAAHRDFIAIESWYEMRTPTTFGVRIATYDLHRDLIIDPGYSLYIGGGNADWIKSLFVDPQGRIYAILGSRSLDIPSSVDIEGHSWQQSEDIVLAVLSATGDSILSITRLGGSSWEDGVCGGVLGSNRVVIAGHTNARDYPTTPDALRSEYLGGANDSFITILDPFEHKLVYSSYFGASEYDMVLAMAVDSSGAFYLTGLTDSPDFPTTPGCAQRRYGGGEADFFVTKFSPDGRSIIYSTFLGGPGWDEANDIDVAADGCAFICGVSGGDNIEGFPTTPGALSPSWMGYTDGVVVKLDDLGTRSLFSTYLGGASNHDICSRIVHDSSGGAYVSGYTGSRDFPTTPGAFQTGLSGDYSFDTFITRIDSLGRTISTSTLLGNGKLMEPDDLLLENGSVFSSGITGGFGRVPTSGGGAGDTLRGVWDAYVVALSSDLSSVSVGFHLGGDDRDGACFLSITKPYLVAGFTSRSTTEFHPSTGVFRNDKPGDADVIITYLELDQLLSTQHPLFAPTALSIGDPYPHPVTAQSTAVTIPFSVPTSGLVGIDIYNTVGVRVAGQRARFFPSGSHAATIDIGHLPSGSYHCRLSTLFHTTTRTFVVLR